MVSMDVLDRAEADLRAGSRCGFGCRVEYSYRKCQATMKICGAVVRRKTAEARGQRDRCDPGASTKIH